MLLFLMDQRNLQATDLAEVFGSEVIASNVIFNQVEFSKEQIKALGKFFRLTQGYFSSQSRLWIVSRNAGNSCRAIAFDPREFHHLVFAIAFVTISQIAPNRYFCVKKCDRIQTVTPGG